MSNGKPETARSYRGTVVDDNAIVSINLKWLGQLLILVGMLVYGYWRIESRLGQLEEEMLSADVKIGDLLDKHMVEEKMQREQLEEKVNFYEKELNINPLSWRKGKRNNGFYGSIWRSWDDWSSRRNVCLLSGINVKEVGVSTGVTKES